MDVVETAKALIAFNSVSVERSNVPISDHLEGLLGGLGFDVERVDYTDERGLAKRSLVAVRGEGPGGFAFLSHSDTVPAPHEGWTQDPFEGTVRDGKLYGRGACDMKGPLAAALCACAAFEDAALASPLWCIVTADEEIGYGGAQAVVESLERFLSWPPICGVITEPTGLEVVHAHKGTVNIRAVAHGVAAHSSTDKGDNANLRAILFAAEMVGLHERLVSEPQYRDERFDPPYPGFNIGINDGNTPLNVTAPRSEVTLYFRPYPGLDAEAIYDEISASAERHSLELAIRGREHGEGMATDPDAPVVRDALRVVDAERVTSVPYGTDGAVFAPYLDQVVLGPGDIAQAHTVNEWIDLAQLERSVEAYTTLVRRFCL